MASIKHLVTWICTGLLLVHSSFVSAAITTPLPDLYEASLTELQAGLTSGQFNSVDLIKVYHSETDGPLVLEADCVVFEHEQAYFARIEEVNLQGPVLRAVIETNPSALDEAAALDYERLLYGPRSALHGIPVLVKDNIGTVAFEGTPFPNILLVLVLIAWVAGMNTTAGSYTLLKSIIPEDAGVVKKLRQAGAIILGKPCWPLHAQLALPDIPECAGKANLSEWAHFRGNLASGWSGRGGQCTNAYYPNADPCGSSSGSAVASSIGLTAAALGYVLAHSLSENPLM